MRFLDIVCSVALRLDIAEPTTLSGAPTKQIRRIMDIVNEAYEIAWNALLPNSEAAEDEVEVSTVQGQEWVTAPFDIIRMVSEKDHVPYAIYPWLEFEQRYRDYHDIDYIASDGEPYACSIYNGKIYFMPTPDDVYPLVIRGSKRFTKLALDDDEPLLNPQHHSIITMLARALYMEYRGDAGAAEAEGKARSYLEEVRRLQRRHGEMTHQIKTLDEVHGYTGRFHDGLSSL